MDYRSIVGTDAEQSKNDDEPPRCKRRKISTAALITGGTASQQQTPSYWSDCEEAQGLPQRPSCQRDHSIPNSSSSSVLDLHCRAQSPRSAASSLGVATRQQSDGCCLSQHYDHRNDGNQTSDPAICHLWFQAVESGMRGCLLCRHKARRVGRARRGCRMMRTITIMSWPIPSHICSRPPAKTGSAFGAISVNSANTSF
ncbi:hypothetical protein VTK26DRAFT_7394 [Humicola hyalothermophila]